jgi:hypothetical protein
MLAADLATISSGKNRILIPDNLIALLTHVAFYSNLDGRKK